MYRDVVKIAKSLCRITYVLPSVWLGYKLHRLSASLGGKIAESMGFARRDCWFRSRDDIEPGVMLFALLMRVYLDLRRSGHTDIVGVRYEDLVDSPSESIRRIFKHCRLPQELVEPGLRGLEVDSQRNSIVSKEAIGSLPEPELTPDVIARANEILRENGLPLIGEECLVEGTITCDRN